MYSHNLSSPEAGRGDILMVALSIASLDAFLRVRKMKKTLKIIIIIIIIIMISTSAN